MVYIDFLFSEKEKMILIYTLYENNKVYRVYK